MGLPVVLRGLHTLANEGYRGLAHDTICGLVAVTDVGQAPPHLLDTVRRGVLEARDQPRVREDFREQSLHWRPEISTADFRDVVRQCPRNLSYLLALFCFL